MGDMVNLASRLEGANKFYATTVMASEATMALTGSAFAWREIDAIRVKGRVGWTKVFEPLGAAGAVSPKQAAHAEAYAEGLARFRAATSKAPRKPSRGRPATIHRRRCSWREPNNSRAARLARTGNRTMRWRKSISAISAASGCLSAGSATSIHSCLIDQARPGAYYRDGPFSVLIFCDVSRQLELILLNNPFKTRYVLEKTLAAEAKKIIAELGILEVDFQ